MATITKSTPVADNLPITDAPAPALRQFHIWYAIEHARTGQWQPFQARIESDNLLDAIRGLFEEHFWRKLFIVTVEFTPIVEQ